MQPSSTSVGAQAYHLLHVGLFPPSIALDAEVVAMFKSLLATAQTRSAKAGLGTALLGSVGAPAMKSLGRLVVDRFPHSFLAPPMCAAVATLLRRDLARLVPGVLAIECFRSMGLTVLRCCVFQVAIIARASVEASCRNPCCTLHDPGIVYDTIVRGALCMCCALIRAKLCVVQASLCRPRPCCCHRSHRGSSSTVWWKFCWRTYLAQPPQRRRQGCRMLWRCTM